MGTRGSGRVKSRAPPLFRPLIGALIGVFLLNLTGLCTVDRWKADNIIIQNDFIRRKDHHVDRLDPDLP